MVLKMLVWSVMSLILHLGGQGLIGEIAVLLVRVFLNINVESFQK